ncbi:MAG: AAA family ATPase [Clostridia bacterium]|nr:AAA family ATPase [Clostridia bacterium]
MLSFLHIENIAVIKKLDIDFSEGFTALTGETGAGKSIIIDSICLLLGARSSRELIRTGEDFARVSAVFCALDTQTANALAALDIMPDEDGTLQITRTIYADGRTQAKINMQTVQVSLLREVGKLLISIQSQHESQTLLDNNSHIDYLDAYAKSGFEIDTAKDKYQSVYREYKQIAHKLSALLETGKEKERMRELLEYQIKDIEALSLKPGEDERLEERRRKLQNAEKLIKGSEFVYRALARNPGGLCAYDLIEKASGALMLRWMGGANPGLLMENCPDPVGRSANGQLLRLYEEALGQFPVCLEQLQEHRTSGKPFGKELEGIFG